MGNEATTIGRVTRCSTRGFIGAARAPEPEIPYFGAFCKADAQQGKSAVIGLIYDISIEDDQLTRQMAAAERPNDEELADQRFVRQVPIEYSALAVGFWSEEKFNYALPPQPPLALALIHALQDDEIRAFTERLDFIPIILSADNLANDELLAAAIQTAASVRSAAERGAFLVDAGRYCARLLANDLTRLENVIRRFCDEK